MALTNFGELKSAVALWLERDDMGSRIPEWVAMAEDRIGLDLRVRAMETETDLTINTQTESLPTGFLGIRSFYLVNDQGQNRKLDYFTPADFFARDFGNTTVAAVPVAFTILGDLYYFGPTPDSTYTGKQHYYKKFTAFSADGDTNWLLTNARGLLMYATLLEASIFLEDEAGVLKYGALYEDMLERVHLADERDRIPRGEARIRIGGATP